MKRLVTVAVTAAIVGVVAGLVLLVAARLLFADGLVHIGPGGLDVAIGSLSAACAYMAFFAVARAVRARPPADPVPVVGEFRMVAPHSVLIDMVCRAGVVPRSALVVRESLTVEMPSCGLSGGGAVSVIKLDVHDGPAWHVFSYLPDRDTGRLAGFTQLPSEASAAAWVAAAYRGDALSWDEAPT